MVKKNSLKIGLLFLCFILTSVSVHKFYVSVTEINYVAAKKEIQITSRFFIDDINNSLEKKYKTKFYLGSVQESEEQVAILKKYLTENFSIKVNSKAKDILFFKKEIEDDVLICYFKVKDVSKISTLEVKNILFFEYLPEQQHITHTHIGKVKRSILLTLDNPQELLKY
jgi:hypothetical protein